MAVAKQLTFAALRRQIKTEQPQRVYLLHGEEGYYIDALAETFEELIPEADRDFNLYIFYAPETDMNTVVDTCRRYPMMADYQVVIVKECQSVTANDLNKLVPYMSSVSPSTVLVLCSRGAKCKSKELEKAVSAAGIVFESAKLRNVSEAIAGFVKEKGLNIEPKGLAMLADYVGSDLSRIYNEIDKLTVALPQGAMITPEVIEKHIGMSKDFNNFELVKAMSERDAAMAFRIADYFKANPKNNPFVLTISMLWTFYSNLLLLLYSKDKSEAGLCAQLGRKGNWLSPDYKNGMRMYNAWQLIEISRLIRRADCETKGVGSRRDPYDIIHDLLFNILNATGR
ncbi:MAG: DNA polymerase III subunit delta [Muribaculum sp.]|nr:DNA polymerase III subunit delta [Muribaculaceae bacterium]MCM1080711.1 DNA polymerase III subunit delta [Muribaculum sp.]